jgi:predicted N-acyltransferase
MPQPAYKNTTIPSSQPLALAPLVRVYETIRDIGREAWNVCYTGELENYDYLLATEEAGIAGFERCYVAAEEGGKMLACSAAFLTYYNLATALEGAPKRLMLRIQKLWPRFLVLKLACLGSPEIESGAVGFHPVAKGREAELLALLLTQFERMAVQKKYRLVGVKDVPARQKQLWDKVALPLGFRPVPGMPTAYLPVDFASIEEYLNRLSSGTRKDMRRKLKALAELRIEHRTQINDVLPQVQKLYLETKARSEFQFEELTEKYFSGVLSHMGARAHCTLYYAGEKLLAANLMLKDQQTLLDKFFCMDAKAGRDYSLYFLSWFTNVGYCVEHGIGRYQSGQDGYEAKLKLASELAPNWLMFKHQNPVINFVLRLVSPLLAMGEGT